MTDTSQKMINSLTQIANEQGKQVGNRHSYECFKITDHFSFEQHKQLKNMLEGNVSGGAGGEDDLSLNWFDVISRKLMNELGLLIKCCSKVLFPPARTHGAQRV